MKVIICGGGIIGAATAHYLARRGVAATVVERAGVANAASGKAGGFLALDWCDGSHLEPLARRSFVLHQRLAEEGFAAWGYRRVATYAGRADALARPRTRPSSAPAPWVAHTVSVDQKLGSLATTAQVDPAALTRGLMAAAAAAGATLVTGTVTGIRRDGAGDVNGVLVDGEVLGADAVVLALGPWSLLAARWLPLPAVYGIKGHSILYRTGEDVPAEALFLQARARSGEVLTPEIFPRADGTTYVSAISSEAPLPVDPAAVEPDRGAFDRLEAMAEDISPAFRRERVVGRQTCFRPVTVDGLPLIGSIPDAPGAYVATGHSVWGILNGPATGEAMADLLVDGDASALDLAPFDPARLAPHRPR